MLFIYQNGVGKYEVVHDENGKENILLTTADINEAVSLFNHFVVAMQKHTLMSWDGQKITNHTKDLPHIFDSPKAKIPKIPSLSSEDILSQVMQKAKG